MVYFVLNFLEKLNNFTLKFIYYLYSSKNADLFQNWSVATSIGASCNYNLAFLRSTGNQTCKSELCVLVAELTEIKI